MQPLHENLSTRAPPPLQILPPISSTHLLLHLYPFPTSNPTTISLSFSLFQFFIPPSIMADTHYQPLRYNNPNNYQQTTSQQTNSNQFIKAATAVTAGGSLLILAGLMLAGTVIALTIATPLFVIFSPVLVPAVIAVSLLGLGFLAAGGFGAAAITVLAWIYRYVTGKHPPGADQLDTARHKLMNKAREIKDYGQQQISGAAYAS